ncbi:MAG TPA: NUDIX hydrolase [Methylomirabilota bacterium]|nr:NUDIX hydrolase [Methylomirabilota bacterium]
MNTEQSDSRKATGMETSAGGIVYKKDGDQIFILVIKPARSNRSPEDPKWGFPKGHIGDHQIGETDEQSAIREVREEGGVEADIIERLGDIHYEIQDPKGNIPKTVTFFLMQYRKGDPSQHDHEVEIAEWLPIDQVMDRIFWPTDKEIFEKAYARLTN